MKSSLFIAQLLALAAMAASPVRIARARRDNGRVPDNNDGLINAAELKRERRAQKRLQNAASASATEAHKQERRRNRAGR